MTAKASDERRASARRTRAQCAWLLAARLRPGRDVRVLDLSNGGALVEAGGRLMPGASIVLHLVSVRGHHTLRGTVLRCYVSAIDQSTGVRYRAALAFDHGFAVPSSDTHPDGTASG